MADPPRIDRATYHLIAPELRNLWAVDAMIHYAREAGRSLLIRGPAASSVDAGEAFAWGVAWAMRAEAQRIEALLKHWGKGLAPASTGQRLGQRVVATARAALKEWRAPRWR